MDPLTQMSPLTIMLTNLSTFFPALAVRTAALLMVVWMTRHVAARRERRLAVIALSLLLASKVFQALAASATTWVFASNHRLMYDRDALMASSFLGSLLPHLLELASLLMLAWVMVKVLRRP